MGIENMNSLWDIMPSRPPYTGGMLGPGGQGGGMPPGMPSWLGLLLPGMLSMLPAGISALMGNPMEARRREAMQAISPEAIQKAQQEAIKRLMNSQGFHMANRMTMMGGQGAMNQMSAGLAKNGMDHSGIGSVVPGLSSLAITNQRGNLLAGVEELGHKEGMDRQQQKFQQLLGYNPGPSRSQSLLAGGTNAFGPLMANWLQGRQNVA